MRVAVLPREVAASVITGAVSRMAWAFGALVLVLDVPVLIETLARADRLEGAPLPVLLLVGQTAALVVAASRPRPAVVAGYLVVGIVLCVGFQSAVLGLVPDAAGHVFLLNRPAVALVAVGVTAGSTLVGIAWVAAGLGAATLAAVLTAVLTGTPFVVGTGPFLVFGLAVVAYLGFGLVQRRSRSRVPDIDELEDETQALVDGANLARRTTAVVHDTVLNDLAIVMNGPERLDGAARDRLRADLATLTGGEWLTTAEEVRPADEQDAQVRNAIASITSDFQWRGLSVQLSGVRDGITRLDPALVEAMIGSIRAALENVLRHSGASAAEVAFAQDDRMLSITVVDRGRGFDPAAIEEDRLGVRESIVARMRAAGGSARIWSHPGEGTSVVLMGPVQEIVAPSTPTRHRRSEHRGWTEPDGG